MTRPRTDAIHHHVVVNAPIERAFAVFTTRFGDFKPREHNLLAIPITETVFECHAGGHIYDRGVDGSVCKWARVLVYEPPSPGAIHVGYRPDLAAGNRSGQDQ